MLLTSKKYRKQTSYVLDIQEKTGKQQSVIFRLYSQDIVKLID